MKVDTKRAMFGFGFFGGVLPTLANMASTYVSAPNTPLPANGMYLGLILWGIVGGGVALMNTSPELRHAIFAGIAAPAIILNIVAGASDHTNRSKRVDLFGMSAYADELLMPTNGGGAVIITPEVTGGVPTSAALPVTADVITAGKTEKVQIGNINDLTSTAGFRVPVGTSKIYVSEQSVPVSGSVTHVSVSVKTKPTFSGDLLWALGLPRNYKIDGLDVSKTK